MSDVDDLELEGANVTPDAPDDEAGDSADAAEGPGADETRGIARLSPRGADFVARFEGVVLKLYNDPANHATIGVGHLVHHGPINGGEPDEFRRGITRERAMQLLMADAGKSAGAVKRLITVPLQQHQLDALISFTFNTGEESLRTSTLRRRLNGGEYDAVPSELARWVFASGKKLPGLVRRREAEGALFSRGTY